MNAPLVHIGGVFRVLQCVGEARPFALLDRFDLDMWADAVRRHRPRAVSLVPAALRMVLHSDLRREDLDGVRAVTSGTAPLSAEDTDAFNEKFGIPVLTSYAATEFGAAFAGWIQPGPDYQKYWQAKRGSVGRANAGASCGWSTTTATRWAPASRDCSRSNLDSSGRRRTGCGPPTWPASTGTASCGILGRADQAIIRGGFKVMPDDVRAALESHPAVAGAAVVGRPDDRLGETPVAMVELGILRVCRRRRTAGVPANPAGPLRDSHRDRDRRPHPRTPSGKPDLSAIRGSVNPDCRRTAATAGRARGAQHPLLVCDAERLSYAEADRRSAQLARGLVALGAGKGTHVGLLYPNGAGFVVGMLAAARIGAVVIPFSTFATAPELGEQLVDSDADILLAAAPYRSHDYRKRGLPISAIRPLLRHVLIDAEPGGIVDAALLEAMEADVDGSDPLAIVYTSGSTSAPKGVVHTHASLLAHQKILNEIRGLTARRQAVLQLAVLLDRRIAFGCWPPCSPARRWCAPTPPMPAETLDLLEAEKPTMTNGFVAGIAHLARHPSLPDRDLSSMRRGNLYPIMAPEVRPADPELRHTMLGMTEAGSVITISDDESDQPEHRRGSFGKPAPGFETMVDDGELCIRGPYVMQRYYKRSREECFDADGWFHTGDLVRTDADGFVYFVGRSGAMIKTAGANVAPAEVERAIAKVDRGDRRTSSASPIPSADSWSSRSSPWRTAPSSTRPRCVSGSRASCLPTRSRTLCHRCRVPTYPCSPAARSTWPAAEGVRCLTPSTGWSGPARRTARRQADGHRPGESRISYAELDETTRAMAAAFIEAGVGKGTRVGLIMPNRVQWVQIAVALTRIGAVLVPLSTLLQPPELVAQLRVASVQYLIAVEEFRGHRYLDDLADV